MKFESVSFKDHSVVSSLSQFSTGMEQFLQTVFLCIFYTKPIAGSNLNVTVTTLGIEVR